MPAPTAGSRSATRIRVASCSLTAIYQYDMCLSQDGTTDATRPGASHVGRPPCRCWPQAVWPEGRRLTPHPARSCRATSGARDTARGGSLPSLRGDRLFPLLCRGLAQSSRGGLRILHFSVQTDHVHLIVEAESGEALSRGLQGLAIRLAKRVNRALGRAGSFWSDRYHARPLRTPREVRNALVYVLQNARKHMPGFRGLDPCSSALWFSGWRRAIPTEAARSPVATPRTWLAAVGWRRHGSIGLEEEPGSGKGRPCRARR